jgi:hypothetical protein
MGVIEAVSATGVTDACVWGCGRGVAWCVA